MNRYIKVNDTIVPMEDVLVLTAHEGHPVEVETLDEFIDRTTEYKTICLEEHVEPLDAGAFEKDEPDFEGDTIAQFQYENTGQVQCKECFEYFVPTIETAGAICNDCHRRLVY